MKIAAIQLNNYIGEMVQSFIGAETLIKEAVDEGAKLVALPELSTCGYIPNTDIWSFGEPREGITSKWAREIAKKYQIYVGAGFLECDGFDFYNSYLIANPQGEIDGVIRKKDVEAYCFKSFLDNNIIETEIGRIGIGICADTHKKWFFKKMKKLQPDLIILPHAWATPTIENKLISKKDITKAEQDLKTLGKIYASNLKVPTMFINSWGKMPTMLGFFGKMMSSDYFSLNGSSAIYLPDGRAFYCQEEENQITVDVDLKVPEKVQTTPQFYHGWLHKGSWIIRKIIIPWETISARKFYKKSLLRIAKAKNTLKYFEINRK